MPRVDCRDLEAALRDVLERAGMARPHAEAVAGIMLYADMIGHATHGLAMLPVYLDRIAAGLIRSEGEIEAVSETPASFAWRCDRMPGAWVMRQAVDKALEMSRRQPVVTATVANCTHIGALAAYLEAPAREGRLTMLMVTDPGVASVAPFGGAEPVLTSDPIACGIPTGGDPILIDQCTSLVSNGQVKAFGDAPLPGDWLVDNRGRPTNDPAVLKTDPPGTIMPLGGADFGYKGYGFMLMCEAFALCLSGHGRSVPQTRGAQGVFLQMIDPAFFSGADSFLDETTHLAQACRNARPADGGPGVRLPGERALSRKRAAEANGIEISDTLWTTARARADALGANWPEPS